MKHIWVLNQEHVSSIVKKGLHQLPLVVKERGFCKFTLVLEVSNRAFFLGSYLGHLFVLDQN
jgi:hypothetical protein